MAHLLNIYTFGGLTLQYGGQIVTGLASRKMEALMLYLVYTGHPHTREQLADLFWSDAPLEQGLGNLRVMLTRLRKVFPEHLTISRQTVGIASGADVLCDARLVRQTLETALARWRNSTRLLPDEVARMEQMLMLYKGQFLEGVSMRGADNFDNWIDSERQRLTTLMSEGGNALISLYQHQQDYAKVLRVARHLLHIDPLQESIHLHLIETYWQLDQRAQALAQYDELAALLRRELAVEPSLKVQTLIERIRQSETPKQKPVNQAIVLPNLPSAFIGRTREKTEIIDLLSQPNCQLLTLLGIGGAGKTRLAIAAAQASGESGLFPDGVYFVSLESADSPNFIVSAIASAMHLASFAIQTTAQLKNYLAKRQVLLVLDNFEHLLEHSLLLTDLLATAQGLKLLITSRERLNLQEEWVYDVNGLECPDTLDTLDSSDAMRFLISTSRQVGVRLSLTLDGNALLRLCHLVDGLPLALEMSAALLRDTSPESLIQKIGTDLDTLHSSLRNIPARQRSLRALFDHAWERLTESDRLILAQLTVFQGSFTPEAIKIVTGAQESALSRLRDKALLQAAEGHRYTLHPVIRQYAAEALATQPIQAKQSADSHAAYYTSLLIAQNSQLHTLNFLSACDVLLPDEENILSALSWYARTSQVTPLQAALPPLEQWLMLTNKYVYADSFMDTLITLLPNTPETRVLHAWILTHGMRFKQAARKLETRHELVESALTDFATSGEIRGQAYLLRLIASQTSSQAGQTQEAWETIEKSLQFYIQSDDTDGYAAALLIKGSIASIMGHYQESSTVLNHALSIETQNPLILPDVYWQLGMNEFYRERFEESLIYYEQSLEIDRTYKLEGHYAKVLIIYGTSLMCIKRFDEAEQAFRQALTFYQDIGHLAYTASCHERMGELLIRRGDIYESQKYYEKAVALYRSANITYGVIDVLTNFGNMCLTEQVLLVEGQTALLDSLSMSRQLQYTRRVIQNLRMLAHIAYLLGEFEQISAYLVESVKMGLNANNLREVTEAFYVLALYGQTTGMMNITRQAAALIFHHPATTEITREYAKTILQNIGDSLSVIPEDPQLLALIEIVMALS